MKNEYGIAVLTNFSCGISVILILTSGIAVFSKPARCVFFAFRSTIVGIKTYPSLFSAIFSRFWSFRKLQQPFFVTHCNLQFDCLNNQFDAVSLFPRSHRSFLPHFYDCFCVCKTGVMEGVAIS